ncbi:hypothetical protein [Salipaludibacillus sp. CF4.18]|uniref:hypothetical protein n=1 Tax=Salipaludibacillus sp. CF4.18 TaxID=3373081 RepID=UPI003EE43ACD
MESFIPRKQLEEAKVATPAENVHLERIQALPFPVITTFYKKINIVLKGSN